MGWAHLLKQILCFLPAFQQQENINWTEQHTKKTPQKNQPTKKKPHQHSPEKKKKNSTPHQNKNLQKQKPSCWDIGTGGITKGVSIGKTQQYKKGHRFCLLKEWLCLQLFKKH